MAQLTFARFLDPLTLVLVALAVGLYLAFRDGGRDGAAGRRSARAGRVLFVERGNARQRAQPAATAAGPFSCALGTSAG